MQPSIYQYLDYRQYLKDVIAHKRQTSATFSLEQLGRKTGCLTKSHISLIVSGKRALTNRRASALGKALGISERELAYYHKLIQFNQAKDDLEKETFLKEMMSQLGRSLEANISMKSYQILEDWHCIAIRELARQPNFDSSPNAVSQKLKGLITPQEAKKAIKVLLDVNMLQMSDDGKIKPTSESLRTTDEVNSIAIRRYHQSCLSLGARIIETEPIESREFGSVTILINPEDISKIKELIKNLRENVLALSASEPSEQAKVTQVNIQMFQLSQ
jgi:uncharacterized protein (TIGR02147 family)